MRDLIDRQAAIDALHSWERVYNWDETCLEDREKVYAPSEVIEALPQAEPEIVRCKDCKHYICHDDDEYPDDQPEWFCHHPELYQDDFYDFAALTMSPDDFCSKGERKESEEPKRDTGEWLSNSDCPDRLICSKCGAQFDVWHWESEQMHFCPNCGADMRGEPEPR